MEELYVKQELFLRGLSELSPKKVYLVDKNNIGHSRKDIEDNVGIAIRRQQTMVRNTQKRNSSKSGESDSNRSVAEWRLETFCKLAAYLGYTVEEMLDEEDLKNIREQTEAARVFQKERREKWNRDRIEISHSPGN